LQDCENNTDQEDADDEVEIDGVQTGRNWCALSAKQKINKSHQLIFGGQNIHFFRTLGKVGPGVDLTNLFTCADFLIRRVLLCHQNTDIRTPTPSRRDGYSGVNFTNILHKAFTLADPKRAIRH